MSATERSVDPQQRGGALEPAGEQVGVRRLAERRRNSRLKCARGGRRRGPCRRRRAARRSARRRGRGRAGDGGPAGRRPWPVQYRSDRVERLGERVGRGDHREVPGRQLDRLDARGARARPAASTPDSRPRPPSAEDRRRERSATPAGWGCCCVVWACGRSRANAQRASSGARSGYSARVATDSSGQCERPCSSRHRALLEQQDRLGRAAELVVHALALDRHERGEVDESRGRGGARRRRRDQPVGE